MERIFVLKKFKTERMERIFVLIMMELIIMEKMERIFVLILMVKMK